MNLTQSNVALTDRVAIDGACIGCGLCAGVSDDAIEMVFTQEMRERPIVQQAVSAEIEKQVAAACPGLVVEGLSAEEAIDQEDWHPVWGYVHHGAIAWAKDPETRHRASTGGVLSALASWLISSGEVDFILQVGPDPDHPARTSWKISTTREEAGDSGGSRYGPAAPLTGLSEVQRLVQRGAKRFAFFGKPCDVSAIRLLAKQKDWLADSLAYNLTIMCGGASEFSKTLKLLESWNISENELEEFRYRGFGNPGPTTAKTKDGRAFDTTYQALWEDESSWALQHRCKICPDAIGMAADLVSFDCWPGGGPEGEDEGFNAVITRTKAGHSLYERAAEAGILSSGRELSPDDYADFQPHQERKRRAVWARLAGQRAAGRTAPATRNLGIEELALENDWRVNLIQARGTRKRLHEGRGTEPTPSSTDVSK